MFWRQQRIPGLATNYASASDFCRVFMQEARGLYLLSFLLTADHKKAEQCFLTALESCQRASRVFKEWAHSWSKRSIIKSAIQVVSPASKPRQSDGIRRIPDPADGMSGGRDPMGKVLRFEPLERFVFVMSVLERHSLQECAALLNCAKREVAAARTRALQYLGLDDGRVKSVPAVGNLQTAHFLEPASAA